MVLPSKRNLQRMRLGKNAAISCSALLGTWELWCLPPDSELAQTACISKSFAYVFEGTLLFTIHLKTGWQISVKPEAFLNARGLVTELQIFGVKIPAVTLPCDYKMEVMLPSSVCWLWQLLKPDGIMSTHATARAIWVLVSRMINFQAGCSFWIQYCDFALQRGFRSGPDIMLLEQLQHIKKQAPELLLKMESLFFSEEP